MKILILLLALCFAFKTNDLAAQETYESSLHKFEVQTVYEGLRGPWAVYIHHDGTMFITERAGKLLVFKNGSMSRPIAGVPKVASAGQGGLLDVALHPKFDENKYLYLTYSVQRPDGSYDLRVSRFVYAESGLGQKKDIFETRTGNKDPNHYGSRMVFGNDGKLYVTLGERHAKDRAQDLDHHYGKTIRLNDDGSIPKDNPFLNDANAKKEIYSYGHRNPQGMDIHPVSGMIVNTEHGPSTYDAPGGGDEVNIIKAGNNYGWPIIHHNFGREGMITPVAEYTPAIAPSGAAFYSGDKFPKWQNDFFFANLKGQHLRRIKFEGEKAVENEILLKDIFGRLRDVADGHDGYIYFITSETGTYGRGRDKGDRLMRLVPAD